ncbi:MAG: conjugal transfer protein TraB [Hyphomicrobiales bacterium]|nr:conjugal transfer protein TraB [Hyphomicrobiales bacterium]
MHRERAFAAVLVGCSAAAGWIGWSGAPRLLPVALLFPLLWSASPTRAVAAFVSAGYFLAASRGLPQGVANFYGSDLWPGLLLWLVASSAFVMVHMLLWTGKRGWHTPLRYLVASVVMALPPFGTLGWAHPVTAAGILFPGWGWLGLAATAAGLAIMTTCRWRVAVVAFSGFWLWSAVTWVTAVMPEGWEGIDLALGSTLGREGGLQRQLDLIATVRQEAVAGARYVVLPESALGYWTPTVERLWREKQRGTGVTVLAGAARIGLDGYDNVMVAVSGSGGSVLYRERMPVPGSMWQPWRGWFGQSGGAHADFFGNRMVAIDGVQIVPLICYEQLLVWPVLHSMLHDPDIIVAIGNGWWTKTTSIVAIQQAATIAWARLFDKPLVTSFNT